MGVPENMEAVDVAGWGTLMILSARQVDSGSLLDSSQFAVQGPEAVIPGEHPGLSRSADLVEPT